MNCELRLQPINGMIFYKNYTLFNFGIENKLPVTLYEK